MPSCSVRNCSGPESGCAAARPNQGTCSGSKSQGLKRVIPSGIFVVMWKTVPGYESYEVHSSGKVRSWYKRIRLWYKPDLSGRRKFPKELKPQFDQRGYARVVLAANGNPKGFLVHRLVALAFLPNPHSYPDVAHLNGNPRDNRVKNLAWMSHKDNQKMMRAHGTQGITSTLTSDQVKYIREYVASHPDGRGRNGESARQIMARKFNVSYRSIQRICTSGVEQTWLTYWK